MQMQRKRTTWKVDGVDVEVEIPTSGSTEAARARFEQNTRDQSERYGFAPPSYTAFSASNDDDAERELTR